MIENRKIDELRLMFKCFARQDSNLGAMVICLCEYIEWKGKAFVEDEALCKDPIAFTAKLLEFKKWVDDLLDQSFNNNIKFEKGRDTAFANFMNLNPATP